MLNQKKIIVVLPAYEAEGTLEKTFSEIDHDIIDKVILVDDASSDKTIEIARRLGIESHAHDQNRGYGGNQKTCYKLALDKGADIVIMLHPDYQYSPKLLVAMAAMIAYGEYDMVIGSRILGNAALKGGMPLYKFIANRFLTSFENILLDFKLSEYHTGYRAYSRKMLTTINFEANSDNFVFDNQLIVQARHHNFRIGEISCPTKYFEGASSINFANSLKYGFGVLWCAFAYLLHNRLKTVSIPWLSSKSNDR